MPSLFDVGAGLNTISSAARTIGSSAQGAFGSLGSVGGTVSKLSAAISNLSSPLGLLSAVRSISLPKGGEVTGKIKNVSAQIGGADADKDWRVKLKMTPGTFFDASPVFRPIREAGGLVFPYTPTISISNTAKYSPMQVTHQNYVFQAYEYSQPNSISISAPFYCETSVEAAYWISTIHFLRSCTKMFTGDSDLQGNPPIILKLSAYGDYVFKNVPVVVSDFKCDLDATSDYIATDINKLGNTNAYGAGLDSINNSVLSSVGLISPNAARTIGQARQVAQVFKGAAQSVASLISGASGGGGSGGPSYAPTKSSITLTLVPVYSRESARTFSLQKFVNGDYVNNNTGYI